MAWLFRSQSVLDPILEGVLVASDGYSRKQVARVQRTLLESLVPLERLRAIAVDIDNICGVVVVTDQRLLIFMNGKPYHDIAVRSTSGARVRRLSSCSYAIRLEGLDVELKVPTEQAADRLLTALAGYSYDDGEYPF